MNYHPTFDAKEWHRHPSPDQYIFRLQLDQFLSEVWSDRLIEAFIDRKNAKIPDTFVPSAKGIATFSQFLVERADREALYSLVASKRPRGWVGSWRHGEVFSSPSFACLVAVRRYDKLWAIEREMPRDGQHVHEVLSLAFGPTPIFHRMHRWAIALAHHCHPNLPAEAQWLRWVPIGK